MGVHQFLLMKVPRVVNLTGLYIRYFAAGIYTHQTSLVYLIGFLNFLVGVVFLRQGNPGRLKIFRGITFNHALLVKTDLTGLSLYRFYTLL